MNTHTSAASEQPLRAELQSILELQRAAFATNINPDRATRLDRLDRLERVIVRNAARFCAVISEDYGGRPELMTALTEIVTTRAAIRHARRHLRRWMQRRSVTVRWVFRPGRAWIVNQPVGVVGIMGSWNFPLQLAISPLVGALAAGNRAMVKPSEVTPRFAAALELGISEQFDVEEVAVVTGGAEVGPIFASLPFDHLLFTGSTAVGRLVAEAAAKNLTPATLELGGKSPALIDASANLAMACDRLIYGKLLNAGQICIAPDYALVPRSMMTAFVDAMRVSVARQYPSINGNSDYTSIVNDRHFERLKGLIRDAQTKGAEIVPLMPDGRLPNGGRRILPPTVILNATDNMAVMGEEIFGPVLPVIAYDERDEAIAIINSRDRPLALYWFGTDPGAREAVLAKTISGGVTINDTMLHFAQDALPFGGIGPSGIGQYHGEYGYRALSKEKPIFDQSRIASSSLLHPPYGPFTRHLVKFLGRFA
jgi:coniferyl-aldehyde dehydrogenase